MLEGNVMFKTPLLDMDKTDNLWNFHKCKLCSYRTRYPHGIGSHMRQQHQTSLKNHRFICYLHSPEKYQCEKCQFQLHQKVLLTRHFNTFHKSQETEHYPNSIERSCKNCKFHTYSLLVLLNHHNRCDGIENRIFQLSQTENNYFKCELEKARNDHPIQHMKHIECSRCAYKTLSESSLKRHVVNKHTPLDQINWFECERCPYRAKAKSELRLHVLRKHTPSEQIVWLKCEHCSCKFKEKKELRRHVLRHIRNLHI